MKELTNMSKYVFTISFIFILTVSYSQNVGINTLTPDASAVLDLNSTESGFLPPRLTETQRDLISSPATGLIIYNLTENCINFYNGTAWMSLCGSTVPPSIVIETQPSDYSECEGSNASFSVTSTGGIDFQWQVNTGSTWEDITEAGSAPVYSGYTSSNLTLTGIVAGNDTWMYRCIISESPTEVISDAASLFILPLPLQPSVITGDTEVCPSASTSTIQEFNSDVLIHGTSASTSSWFAPDYNTPIEFASSGGCPDGHVGYSGSWNDYWGNFLRLPEMDCSGNNSLSISFDVSHSYFASHPDDWCRLYMWVDEAYENNITSIMIEGVDVTYDSGINGKGFKFSELRSCDSVMVTFDISSVVDKSNILIYIEPSCAYNNSDVFYVWLDNISVISTELVTYDYSVIDEGYTYTWQVPIDWTIDLGQSSNIITVSPGSLDGDVIVTPSNACGNGPSQSISVDVCP